MLVGSSCNSSYKMANGNQGFFPNISKQVDAHLAPAYFQAFIWKQYDIKITLHTVLNGKKMLKSINSHQHLNKCKNQGTTGTIWGLDFSFVLLHITPANSLSYFSFRICCYDSGFALFPKSLPTCLYFFWKHFVVVTPYSVKKTNAVSCMQPMISLHHTDYNCYSGYKMKFSKYTLWLFCSIHLKFSTPVNSPTSEFIYKHVASEEQFCWARASQSQHYEKTELFLLTARVLTSATVSSELWKDLVHTRTHTFSIQCDWCWQPLLPHQIQPTQRARWARPGAQASSAYIFPWTIVLVFTACFTWYSRGNSLTFPGDDTSPGPLMQLAMHKCI